MADKINLAEKLASFDGYWQPRVVGGFNGHDLMVVKVRASSFGTSTPVRTISSSC